MSTPDLTTAVEAGARACFDHDQAVRRDDGRKRPDGGPWQWDDLRPIDKHAYRSRVVHIVAAALATVETEPDLVTTSAETLASAECPDCGHNPFQHDIAGGCTVTSYGPPEDGFHPATSCACDHTADGALIASGAVRTAAEVRAERNEALDTLTARTLQKWQAEDERDALRARVNAIADEWEGEADAIAITYQDADQRARATGWLRTAVRVLRAALAEEGGDRG